MKAGGNTFSVFKGTISEKTTTDMSKWAHAIHLMLDGKEDVFGKSARP